MNIKIDYLEKLGYQQVSKIETLKTTLFAVDKSAENKEKKIVFSEDGKTSKLTKPDLRYFWDGEQFGLHISDDITFSSIKWIELLKGNSDKISKLKVIYIGNTEIETFGPMTFDFTNVSFLYLSQNPNLSFIDLNNFSSLNTFVASQCMSLKKVEFNGNYELLEKIDVSFCSIDNFDLKKSNFSFLSLLNVANNKIVELDLTITHKLQYLFVQENESLKLILPKQEKLESLSILGVDKTNRKLSNDIIEIATENSDEELREKLNKYLSFEGSLLSQLLNKGETSIDRYQIMLIGNTTAGKTELKYRFLNEDRLENEKSTHGVLHFTKNLEDGVEVIGYDFGGQDYYHALHLPFFDEFTHYFVIFGNDMGINWGSYDYETFSAKSEENQTTENLLFPLSYWLKSISFQSIKRTNIEENEKSINAQNQSESGKGHKPKVDIIQNYRKDTKEQFLNIKKLKLEENIEIGEIVSFDFKEIQVGKWLEKRLQSVNKEINSILLPVLSFGKKIKIEEKVIYTKDELRQRIKIENPKIEESFYDEFINSLRRNRYLFYPGLKNEKLKDFYIVHIDKFTEYLYQVLNKELSNSKENQGYFYKKEAKLRLNNTLDNEKEFIFNFLIESDIIFIVSDIGDGNAKYVAPSYLPEPTTTVEKLFIQSFETPDCEFEFSEFFHANLILQVVKKYQEKLVLDDKKMEYLNWKNCVIIYNTDKISNQIEKFNEKPKDFLKLELHLPNKEKPNLIPNLTIARNNAGLIENDQFYKVFFEIKELLNKYSPKINVKPPYGDNIPYADIEKVLTEGINKQSQFVYSNGVLYPKYDFRHFLGADMKAPLKIFIAYSKFDDLYRLELKDHLLPEVNEGRFIVFDDREMDMGEKWNARLKKELEQCDVFIVLISVKTLGTSFVMNTEIPKAKERYEKGNLKKIIPILISSCDWQKTGLASLNVFDKANPITALHLDGLNSVNERAEKWQEIVENLNSFHINSNGSNPTSSPTPTNEHSSNDYQSDGGEQSKL